MKLNDHRGSAPPLVWQGPLASSIFGVFGDLASGGGHQAAVVAVRKSEDVIFAGKQCNTFFINKDGWFYRYRILRNGRRQILNFILPGESFGLQSHIFNHSPFSVSAITNASLFAIPFDDLDKMFERDPKFARSLLDACIYNSILTAERAINVARHSARRRIAYFLLALSARLNGRKVVRAFEMPLTQELIADALGLTTVHVNRTLRSFRVDKLLTIKGKHVEILNYDRLVALADFDESHVCEPIVTHVH